VLYPIGRYLALPWKFRRDRLFGLLGRSALCFYYQQFRPGCVTIPKNVTDPQEIQGIYLANFVQDFDGWYGRRYYTTPVCCLAVLASVCAWWAVSTIQLWILNPSRIETLHGLVAGAIGGAFMWVISDEIDRLRRHDFTTSDVYYYIFRILLAVPFGWALTSFHSMQLKVGIPIAFFLGAFPTTTLFTAARRIAGTSLGLGEEPDGTIELEKLQSIGKDHAERFKDEGISTIVQLAYTDPVDLTIRTNYEFNFIVDCVSQALLWMYIQPAGNTQLANELNLLSLRGALEVAALVDWIANPECLPTPQPTVEMVQATAQVSQTAVQGAGTSNLKYSPATQEAAKATLAEAATKLGISEKALLTTFSQIVQDPYAKFLVHAWG
jgi:hypothetical protein